MFPFGQLGMAGELDINWANREHPFSAGSNPCSDTNCEYGGFEHTEGTVEGRTVEEMDGANVVETLGTGGGAMVLYCRIYEALWQGLTVKYSMDL